MREQLKTATFFTSLDKYIKLCASCKLTSRPSVNAMYSGYREYIKSAQYIGSMHIFSEKSMTMLKNALSHKIKDSIKNSGFLLIQICSKV